mgnify:CR=1 FL=1
MQKRGKKSIAEILVKPASKQADCILPPETLTPDQCDIFEQLVANLPDGLITEELVPLVAQLSRHLLTCKRLATWTDKIENGAFNEFESKEYFAVLEQRRKETASALSIMRSLRLTNQSRYRADSAKLDRPSGKKPWIIT